MSLPSITAPSGLPRFFADQHEIDEDSVYAQVRMATGHSRARRVWTVTEREVAISWWLDVEQLADFDAWYEDDLQAGTLEFAAEVADQADPLATLWWRARWIEVQTLITDEGGHVTGRLLLTGEGSAEGPDTGALAAEFGIALIDISSSVSIPVVLAAEFGIALEQPTVLRMEISIALELMQMSQISAACALTLGASGTLSATGALAGVASMTFGGAALGIDDPAFANVVLLLHCDGGSGGSVVTDSSSYNRAQGAGSTINLNTGTKKFGTASSAHDGATRVIRYTDVAAFTLGTSDFTIELWVNFGGTGTLNHFFGRSDSAGNNSSADVALQRTAGNKIRFLAFSGSSAVIDITGTTTISATTWYYVAVTRSGSTFNLYVGTAGTPTLDGTASSAASLNDSSNDLGIGALGEATTNMLAGHIDEVRYTIGTARSISAVPSAPFQP